MTSAIVNEQLKVSVIMTVFNEAASIQQVLATLAKQSRRPDEIVIVDGGSTDDTVAKIEQFCREQPEALNIQVIVEKGANISQGRNKAIAAAKHEIIAATDAGVRLENNWLERLITPFSESENTEVVSGFFQADPNPNSPFEIALGATTLPLRFEIEPEKFLPSSRSVAFTKKAWQAAGGYPEWLDYCEDLIFDLNLKKQRFSFVWQPTAVAYFRPRSTPLAFYKQYYRYARGDGKANLFLKRHLIRYATYLVFAPLLIWLSLKKAWAWLLLLGGVAAYTRTPYRRLLQHTPAYQQLSLPDKVLATLWVPLIRVIGDVAKMCGYPVGIIWKFRHK